MTEREALKLALEALENTTPTGFNMEQDKQFFAAITAIREALAQPEQEPVVVSHSIEIECQKCGATEHGSLSFTQSPPQPEQEPVAWPVGWVDDGGTVFWKDKPPADGVDLYTTPPQPEQSQVEETLRYEIDALENKLAECRAQQPEPVIDKSAAVRIATSLGWEPKRKPLTDEQILELNFDGEFCVITDDDEQILDFARAIEAAHGIKE